MKGALEAEIKDKNNIYGIKERNPECFLLEKKCLAYLFCPNFHSPLFYLNFPHR